MEDGIISVCTPEPDTRRATWVVERCGGPLFTVNRWMPAGFERYIQVCPPAWQLPESEPGFRYSPLERSPGTPANLLPVPWARVASARGHEIGEHTAYWDLTPHADPYNPKPGDYLSPLEETPTGAMVDAIGDAVLGHSDAQEECIVAVWSSYATRDDSERLNAPANMITGMGQQEHFLFSAPLETVIGKWRSLLPDLPVSASSVASLSPQALWPASGDWFYAVPFDWNSSFFAGPAGLTEKLLTDDRIESYPLSLAADFRHESQKHSLADS